jgi:hypothetical protein
MSKLRNVRPTEWVFLAVFVLYLLVARAWTNAPPDPAASDVDELLWVLAAGCLFITVLGYWTTARRKCWFSFSLFLCGGTAQLYFVLFHDIGNETGTPNRGTASNYFVLFIACLGLFVLELMTRSRLRSKRKLG